METTMGERSVNGCKATTCWLVAAAICLIGCGGGGGGSANNGSGSYSWSVSVAGDDGALQTCANYTNQKVSAADAMKMVQGGTVSADPCPNASNVIGSCTGADAGGNDYEFVFYNFTGLTGTQYELGVQSVKLTCSTGGGTWSDSYDGKFDVGNPSHPAGGSGGSSSGGCAKLKKCCDAATAQLKTACTSTYTAVAPNENSCEIAYTTIQQTYCPGV